MEAAEHIFDGEFADEQDGDAEGDVRMHPPTTSDITPSRTPQASVRP